VKNKPTFIFYDTLNYTNEKKKKCHYFTDLYNTHYTSFFLSTFFTDLFSPTLENNKQNANKCFKDACNFTHSLIALFTFTRIKNDVIAAIITEFIPNFFKLYILDTTSYFSHFVANWILYVEEVYKITTRISVRLILKKNTKVHYISVNNEKFTKKVKNNPNYITFHIKVYNHLQKSKPIASIQQNITDLVTVLDKVTIETTRHNLKQVIL
jgi:hypothetical protein